MCCNPKWIYKEGRYKENNYRGGAGESYALGTYSKCGSCAICLAEKSNNWVIRNYYEEKRHKKKCFITLTYAENSCILVRKDLQDFIKRLRTYIERKGSKEKFRYFYCGEYGERNGRPHYHLIIYGWEDNEAKYLGWSGKKQICYRSSIIEECWGLGRTSYQSFSTKEAPYIALYNTPQETFKHAYKMTRKKAKKLENYARNNLHMPKHQRNNLLAELKQIKSELDEEEAKYKLIKEFNGWSLALGWEEFENEYINEKAHTWQVYIEDKEFVVPSPWVKKLANMGDIEAAQEMYRREELIQQSATEEEEALKSLTKHIEKETKEKLIKANDTQKNEISSNL